jgi:hypothetical protein
MQQGEYSRQNMSSPFVSCRQMLDFINKRQNKKIFALRKAADTNKDGGIQFEEFCEIPENAGNPENDNIPMPMPEDVDVMSSDVTRVTCSPAAGRDLPHGDLTFQEPAAKAPPPPPKERADTATCFPM